jgi:hypothetical protein
MKSNRLKRKKTETRLIGQPFITADLIGQLAMIVRYVIQRQNEPAVKLSITTGVKRAGRRLNYCDFYRWTIQCTAGVT